MVSGRVNMMRTGRITALTSPKSRPDTHSAPVYPAVWELYDLALRLFGRVPTLIEWDLNLPDLDVLVSEAARADRMLERRDALVA